VNNVGDDSPDFKGLLSLDHNGLIVFVGRQEAQGFISLVESLDRQVSVECSHDHVPVHRAIHDEQFP